LVFVPKRKQTEDIQKLLANILKRVKQKG